MNANFSIIFQVRETKKRKNGNAPIEAKVTMQGKRLTMTLNREIDPLHWDQAKQRAKFKCPDQKMINDYLGGVKSRIYEIERQLIREGLVITPELIRDAFNNSVQRLKERTLLSVFSQHNEQSEAMRGQKGYSDATLWINTYTFNLLTDYILTKLKRKDIFLKELDLTFIKGFHVALLQHMGQNSATKHLKLLKKIINLSIANRWINYDPFIGYKIERNAVNIEYLTAEELTKVVNQPLNIIRWERARDMFVFACYTGLAYIDVIKLQPDDIKTIDGVEWISKERTKTGVTFSVPLLPEAKAILDKYSVKGEFVPKLDRSDVNKYVKDIAAICRINKRITFHTARHTFATTVTLSKRVPIEVVARMLGHKNTRITSHYAKVVDSYILDAMKDLLK